MASLLDITRNIRAEREIKILDSAIASSNNGIAILDPEERLIYANRAFFMMSGTQYSPEMKGKNLVSSFTNVQNISPSFGEIKERLINDGSYTGEVRYSLPEGTVRFVQFSANIAKDENDTPICVVLSAIDITDQKMMEKTLKSTFEKLQDAIEFIPDPTFIVDHNKKVIAWNRPLEILTCIKRETVLGKSNDSGLFSILKNPDPFWSTSLIYPPMNWPGDIQPFAGLVTVFIVKHSFRDYTTGKGHISGVRPAR